MPIGCSIAEVKGGFDLDDLESHIGDYSRKWNHENVDQKLQTDTTDLRPTDRGVEFVLRYDRPFQVGSRPGESGWYKETISATIRLSKDVMSDVAFLIGPKHKRNRTVSELAQLLGKPHDEIEVTDIEPSSITKILGDDSIDSNFGWWKDIDSSTESASVTGDIKKSTHARNISSKGEPTWVVFISEYASLKVGVSTDNVVFYGNEWTSDDIEEYLTNVVVPHL